MAGKLSVNGSLEKAQLKDNLYFINAAKLHYCSHTQSYCPHSRLRPERGGVMEGRERQQIDKEGTEGAEGGRGGDKKGRAGGDREKKSDMK